MIGIAAAASIFAGVLVLGFAAATSVVSDKFFRKLIAQHPELANAFPKPMFGTRYGPILPSRMAYLKEKRFNSLADPSLRQLGRQARMLLTAHAVTFAAFVVASLVWAGIQADP